MVHCSRMSIFCLLLSDAFFGKFKKKKKKQKSRKASISNDCYSTLLPVCDPDDIMPSQPCVNEDEQKKLKKPRGPITHTEVVRFLNKKLTYNARSRNKKSSDTARVCCGQKNFWKNLKIISKMELYKEATDLHELCEELMTTNQENELTKYSKLKKQEFLPLCVWLNLIADNYKLTTNSLLAEGTGMVCPTHLAKIRSKKYKLAEDDKAPICLYLLYKDPAFYINSEHSNLCGKRFRVMAHYLIKSSTSKLSKKYTRSNNKDSAKCLWTRVDKCEEEYPEVPCHRKPETWPKKYKSAIKQRKTYVINFLNEKLSYVERNNNHQGCCKRRSFYKILSGIYKSVKISEHAESCMALVEAHQATKKKIKKFDKTSFVSFCVLAKQMAENKQNVQDGLLRVKTHDRLCVLRAVDTSRYDVDDDKSIYCTFVKMRHKKDYEKNFESLCE